MRSGLIAPLLATASWAWAQPPEQHPPALLADSLARIRAAATCELAEPLPQPEPPRFVTTQSSCSGLAGARSFNPSQAHVRVSAPRVSERRIVGDLVASDEATLSIRRTDLSTARFGTALLLTVPRDSVKLLERQTRASGKSHGVKTGAAIGAVIGAVVGAGLTVALIEAENDTGGCSGCIFAVGLGALAGGVAGALPGALVGGAVAPAERWVVEDPGQVCVDRSAWERPRDPVNARLGLGPVRGGGIAFRLAVAF